MPPRITKKKRKGEADEDVSAKKAKARKPLTPAQKRKAKDKAKGPVIERARRITRQVSHAAYGDMSVITAPTYEAFAKKGRGCKRASITIGPRIGVETNVDSDADSGLPGAITRVREVYPGYGWKAGHVINADFGGDGKRAANMTCLTASANGLYRAFDEPIKRARVALHHTYTIMRKCGAQKAFFTTQKYGIKIIGVVSEEAWDGDYPGNCIADEVELTAEIVGAPDEAKLREVMRVASGVGSLENDITKVLEYMATVRTEVAAANDAPVVVNVQVA